MSGLDYVEFQKRIARIERARALGRGFEAEGTLGRSFYHKPARKSRRLPLVQPLFSIFVLGTTLKALMILNVGIPDYLSRVEALTSGDGFGRLGSWVMQADPITLATADAIKAMMAGSSARIAKAA